jgi:hypothetical protein
LIKESKDEKERGEMFFVFSNSIHHIFDEHIGFFGYSPQRPIWYPA